MPRTLLVALLAALALTGPATTALASGRDVLNDCTDDEVMQKTYTQKEYRDALAQLAGDTDQYGNCRDVIKRAQLKAAAGDAGAKKQGTAAPAAPAGGSTGGGSGAIGSAPAREQLQAATPTERQAVAQARTNNDAFQLDNTKVDPSKVGTVPGVSRVSDLPTPLAVVLALLLVAALALAALRLRSLVHARRA
ncbi:MAG: hypothetical protein QOD69_1887 [Solirubrobacteraceae bacterium]|jgi:hypothetical protein|nr:hypothetical protein [Solirubrobacteraceae bacterium]